MTTSFLRLCVISKDKNIWLVESQEMLLLTSHQESQAKTGSEPTAGVGRVWVSRVFPQFFCKLQNCNFKSPSVLAMANGTP